MAPQAQAHTSGTSVTDRCVACGGESRFRSVLRDLEQCTACGFVTFRNVAPSDLKGLYDETYFTGDEYPDYLGQHEALRRSMRRHLGQMLPYGVRPRALLEVGCAYGLFLDEARSCFERVVGVDICEAPIRYAREALSLDVRLGDFTGMDFGGAAFDVICMWDTIEHLQAPDRFLEKAGQLLAKDGFLFLTTGDIGSLNARLRGANWRQIHPPSHLNYFSRATITRLLRRTGFEIAGIQTASYYHTLYNVLASLRLRSGSGRRVAAGGLSILGERLARRAGLWINLGDIMFVAARWKGTSH